MTLYKLFDKIEANLNQTIMNYDLEIERHYHPENFMSEWELEGVELEHPDQEIYNS